MCRIGGTVTVDLQNVNPFTVARRMKNAAEAPRGAEVTFLVGPGQQPPVSATHYVREYGRSLGSVTVSCSDPATVRRWVDALRHGIEVA